MKEDLLKFIPEFNLIEDSDLKEKVLKVWDIALTAGGWEVSDLQRMPFTLLIDTWSSKCFDRGCESPSKCL